jgi:hypothetical protein
LSKLGYRNRMFGWFGSQCEPSQSQYVNDVVFLAA